MSDYLTSASDPRVIAVVLARAALRRSLSAAELAWLLSAYVVTDEDQASDLLVALDAWDKCVKEHKNDCDARENTRTSLDVALDAIFGPAEARYHRLSVNINDECAEIRQVMSARRMSATEETRRALGLLDFVEKTRAGK